MLFTNFLRQNNILQEKQNCHSNKQNRQCIIQKKQKIQVLESTPHFHKRQKSFDLDYKLIGSTPLSSKQIPDLEHISQLLSMKKKQKLLKSPQKQCDNQTHLQESKKYPIKLCLNCQKFIDSKGVIDHEKECQGFKKLLSFSRNQLLDLIISKILRNQMELSEKKQSNQHKESITFSQQKIANLVKMKLRLQSKIKTNK